MGADFFVDSAARLYAASPDTKLKGTAYNVPHPDVVQEVIDVAKEVPERLHTIRNTIAKKRKLIAQRNPDSKEFLLQLCQEIEDGINKKDFADNATIRIAYKAPKPSITAVKPPSKPVPKTGIQRLLESQPKSYWWSFLGIHFPAVQNDAFKFTLIPEAEKTPEPSTDKTSHTSEQNASAQSAHNSSDESSEIDEKSTTATDTPFLNSGNEEHPTEGWEANPEDVKKAKKLAKQEERRNRKAAQEEHVQIQVAEAVAYNDRKRLNQRTTYVPDDDMLGMSAQGKIALRNKNAKNRELEAKIKRLEAELRGEQSAHWNTHNSWYQRLWNQDLTNKVMNFQNRLTTGQAFSQKEHELQTLRNLLNSNQTTTLAEREPSFIESYSGTGRSHSGDEHMEFDTAENTMVMPGNQTPEVIPDLEKQEESRSVSSSPHPDKHLITNISLSSENLQERPSLSRIKTSSTGNLKEIKYLDKDATEASSPRQIFQEKPSIAQTTSPLPQAGIIERSRFQIQTHRSVEELKKQRSPSSDNT